MLVSGAPLLALLALVAAAPDLRSAQTEVEVEETKEQFVEVSQKHDAANEELMEAIGVYTAAQVEATNANLAASFGSVNTWFSAADPSPPPPPWYVTQMMNRVDRGEGVALEKLGEMPPSLEAAGASVAGAAAAVTGSDPELRNAETEAAVEETKEEFVEVSQKHDKANEELMEAIGVYTKAQVEATNANLAASFGSVNTWFSASDPSPPPPPWYITEALHRNQRTAAPAEKLAATPEMRSATTTDSAEKTDAAAVEANKRRDEANAALWQATSNALNLNNLATTERLAASFAWAANAATPLDPSPPPPPAPMTPGYDYSSQAFPSEKTLALEDSMIAQSEPATRSATTAESVAKTEAAAAEANARRDEANAKLWQATNNALNLNNLATTERLAATFAWAANAAMPYDPAPPPPPAPIAPGFGYLLHPEEKVLEFEGGLRAEPQLRSATTAESVAKTEAAAAEANARRDEANAKLWQATNNALNLNNLATTERLAATFAWAANAAMPYDPAPPPPPAPIAPGFGYLLHPDEKVLSVEEAEALDLAASERFDAAAARVAKANGRAIDKGFGTVQPVLRHAVSQVFVSSPPPPPLNVVKFGANVLTAAATGDTIRGVQAMNSGSNYGTDMAKQILGSVQGEHRGKAQQMNALLHMVSDSPPPPPSAQAAIEAKKRADIFADRANAEMRAATAAKMKTSADLAHARVGAAFGVTPPSKELDSEQSLLIPEEKVKSVAEAEAEAQAASEELLAASEEVHQSHVKDLETTAAAVQPVIQETIQSFFPSPSPPPPPFTGTLFGMELFQSSTALDTDTGSKVLAGGADFGINMAHDKLTNTEGMYKDTALAADNALHLATDKPPPPPSAKEFLAAKDEADAAVDAAHSRLAAAINRVTVADTELIQSKAADALGMAPESEAVDENPSFNPDDVIGFDDDRQAPAEKSAPIFQDPEFRSVKADEAAIAAAKAAEESNTVADKANDRLANAISTNIAAQGEYMSTGASHVGARLNHFVDVINPFAESPSPPPAPPFTAVGLGIDLIHDVMNLDPGAGLDHASHAAAHVQSHPEETATDITNDVTQAHDMVEDKLHRPHGSSVSTAAPSGPLKGFPDDPAHSTPATHPTQQFTPPTQSLPAQYAPNPGQPGPAQTAPPQFSHGPGQPGPTGGHPQYGPPHYGSNPSQYPPRYTSGPAPYPHRYGQTPPPQYGSHYGPSYRHAVDDGMELTAVPDDLFADVVAAPVPVASASASPLAILGAVSILGVGIAVAAAALQRRRERRCSAPPTARRTVSMMI